MSESESDVQSGRQTGGGAGLLLEPEGWDVQFVNPGPRPEFGAKPALRAALAGRRAGKVR